MLRRLLRGLLGPKGPEFVLPEESELVVTESGLGVQVLESGQGAKPAASDKVTVRYCGWLTDGQRFDSSFPGTATFGLSQVIGGWTEGLQHLSPGGSARLVIPPHLGYGKRGAPPRIGPDATLIFHVELVSIG